MIFWAQLETNKAMHVIVIVTRLTGYFEPSWKSINLGLLL